MTYVVKYIAVTVIDRWYWGEDVKIERSGFLFALCVSLGQASAFSFINLEL